MQKEGFAADLQTVSGGTIGGVAAPMDDDDDKMESIIETPSVRNDKFFKAIVCSKPMEAKIESGAMIYSYEGGIYMSSGS